MEHHTEGLTMESELRMTKEGRFVIQEELAFVEGFLPITSNSMAIPLVV
jgi:hypothetical protein